MLAYLMANGSLDNHKFRKIYLLAGLKQNDLKSYYLLHRKNWPPMDFFVTMLKGTMPSPMDDIWFDQ